MAMLDKVKLLLIKKKKKEKSCVTNCMMYTSRIYYTVLRIITHIYIIYLGSNMFASGVVVQA